ncbi:glycogen synthase [Bacteroidia bacterium]|nr:glycogen synthase [Bacteroidia bacterium]
MSQPKILFVCQEMTPYLPDSAIATGSRELLHAVYERGFEVRTFMPKYNCINERRNQLHEVIRLSGMNLIIGNNDHQLVIKVASIPSVRAQVYFIDNDDYFSRKATTIDPQGEPFADNDERAIFFARGVVETVKKLRWQPDFIHCVGWFSAIVPIYLRSVFADDPMFRDVKVLLSLYDNGFSGALNSGFRAKMEAEGVASERLETLDDPTYANLIACVLRSVDGVVLEEPIDPQLAQLVKDSGRMIMERSGVEREDWDKYKIFYEQVQNMD